MKSTPWRPAAIIVLTALPPPPPTPTTLIRAPIWTPSISCITPPPSTWTGRPSLLGELAPSLPPFPRPCRRLIPHPLYRNSKSLSRNFAPRDRDECVARSKKIPQPLAHPVTHATEQTVGTSRVQSHRLPTIAA